MHQQRWRVLELRTDVQPPMRYKATAVTMDDHKKVFVFGGLGAQPNKSLWMLDLDTKSWIMVRDKANRGPCARLYHSMTVEKGSNCFYVFGGQTLSVAQDLGPRPGEETRDLRYRSFTRRPLLSDVYQFDVGRMCWLSHTCLGKPCPPRRAHTTTFVSDRAGATAPTPAKPDGEQGRRPSNTMKMTFPKRLSSRELLVIGGVTENRKGHEVAVSEIWALNVDTMAWQMLQTNGPAMAGRFDHTATMIGRRIFVIGGLTTSYADLDLKRHFGEVQAEVGILDVDTLCWSRLTTDSLEPSWGPALHGHCACLDPWMVDGREDALMVFGGRGPLESPEEMQVYRLDVYSGSWSVLSLECSPATPSARHGHVCLVIREKTRSAKTRGSSSTKAKPSQTPKARDNPSLKNLLKPPSSRPLFVPPVVLIFGGSILDGSPPYHSGHVLCLERTQGGLDDFSLVSASYASQVSNQEMGQAATVASSATQGQTDRRLQDTQGTVHEGFVASRININVGSQSLDYRSFSAPHTFNRSTSRTNQAPSPRYPDDAPWEYWRVKELINRHRARTAAALLTTTRPIQQHSQPLQETPAARGAAGRKDPSRKPATAPARLNGMGSRAGASIGVAHMSPEMPTPVDRVVQTSIRLGLQTKGLPHQSIYQQKKIYLEKLKKSRSQARAKTMHAHTSTTSTASLPHVSRGSVMTLRGTLNSNVSAWHRLDPTSTHQHDGASSSLFPVGMRSRTSAAGGELSVLTALDPETASCGMSISWRLISKHTPTVSLGREVVGLTKSKAHL